MNSQKIRSSLVYYVYAYLRKEDNSPYYIGKGKGNRAFVRHNRVITPRDKNQIVFLETNLSEIGALAIERRMILWYGRKDLGTGILRNQTDGGDCPPDHTGMKRTEEAKQRMRKSHKGFTGLKHSQESIDKWTKTRKENGSYNLTDEWRQRLRENTKKSILVNNIKVCVFGIHYSSQKEACEKLGIGYKYLKRRLESDSFVDCYYL